MTISTLIIKNSYNGDNSETVFPYNFSVTSEADIEVIVRSALGVEVVKSLAASDYTVNGVGVSTGGNVTMAVAPVTGETIFVRRKTVKTQPVDLVENDPFSAETVEGALDKAMSVVQELQEEIDRSIKLSRTNTIGSAEFSTDATARAGKVLAFDSSGELQSTQELGQSKGNWATGTVFAVRDIVKDASNSNVYIAKVAHTSTGSTPISSNADVAKWELLVDAETAAASAATATAKAIDTAADAVTTAGHVVTTTSNKDDAVAAKVLAEAARDVANSSRDTANASRDTAITKAGEADASAVDAAASATSAAASAGGGVVRVTSSDTNANVLNEKFLAGTDITFEVQNAGADEKILIAAPFSVVYAIALGG
tara:strand:+ start:1197 stop:2306 length:1110 start_codon:yes stop_codon:yes gene_type:complete